MSMPPIVCWPVDAVLDPVGQHDHAGAGAVGGHALLDPHPQRLEQVEGVGELPHRGGLPAGDDQAVDRVQLLGPAYGDRRAPASERAQMLAHVSLQGEHTDRRGRCHRWSFHGPGMPLLAYGHSAGSLPTLIAKRTGPRWETRHWARPAAAPGGTPPATAGDG